MQNIYEQVDQNKSRSFWIIALFIAFFAAVGYAVSYVYGTDYSYLGIALLFSFGGSFVSYYYSDSIALGIAGATPVSKKSHPIYLSAVENLSRVAGVPIPKTYLITSPAMNAFATGRDPSHAAIAVTQGLLDKLTRTELEGVVAHELSHIKNYDTRLMTLVAVLVGSITIVLDWVWRMNMMGGRDNDDNKGKNPILLIAGIALIILAPIIATLMQLAISRRREFFADAQAALLTRQPSGLIGALKKISSDKTPLEQATPATAPLYISNPIHDGAVERWLGSLFSTHPPVAERVKALEGNL